MGARDLRRARAPAPVAAEPEGDGVEHSDAGGCAAHQGDTGPFQERAGEAAARDAAHLQGASSEPVRRVPADAPAHAGVVRAVLCVREHHRIPGRAVPVAPRPVAPRPVLHHSRADGPVDVRALQGRPARRAAQPASADDGVHDAARDDAGAVSLRLRPEPVLRRAERLQHSAAVSDRAAAAAAAGQASDVTGTVLSDPIVALATPPGRSALALLRLSGTGAFDVAARCLRPFLSQPPRTARRARLAHPGSGEAPPEGPAACFSPPPALPGGAMLEGATHSGPPPPPPCGAPPVPAA